MIKVFIVILIILLSSSGQILFKYAALSNQNFKLIGLSINRFSITSIIIYLAVPFVINFAFLHFPLKEIQAHMALNYSVVSISASFIFREKLNPKRISAIVLISFGVFIFNSHLFN